MKASSILSESASHSDNFPWKKVFTKEMNIKKFIVMTEVPICSPSCALAREPQHLRKFIFMKSYHSKCSGKVPAQKLFFS